MNYRGLVLVPALAMCGCGMNQSQGGSEQRVHPSDPYVQALDAVFNLKGCQKNQDSRVLATISGLASVESEAKARGLERYATRAHQTFEVSISDVLRVLCQPDFDRALRAANTKTEELRMHLERLPSTAPVNQ